MTTDVYLVRHAHSPYVPEREATRGLSERGERDAERLADALSSHVDLVVSSPYERARQTVEPLARTLGTGVVVRDNFRERRLAGGHVDDFDTAVDALWRDPEHALPGGESNLEAQARGVAAVDWVRETYPEQSVVVGTHGTLLALILGHYDAQFDADFWRALSMPDVYRLRFDGPTRAVERVWAD